MRMPNGLKGNRLSLILAVLSKHARMPLYKVPPPLAPPSALTSVISYQYHAGTTLPCIGCQANGAPFVLAFLCSFCSCGPALQMSGCMICKACSRAPWSDWSGG